LNFFVAVEDNAHDETNHGIYATAFDATNMNDVIKTTPFRLVISLYDISGKHQKCYSIFRSF